MCLQLILKIVKSNRLSKFTFLFLLIWVFHIGKNLQIGSKTFFSSSLKEFYFNFEGLSFFSKHPFKLIDVRTYLQIFHTIPESDKKAKLVLEKKGPFLPLDRVKLIIRQDLFKLVCLFLFKEIIINALPFCFATSNPAHADTRDYARRLIGFRRPNFCLNLAKHVCEMSVKAVCFALNEYRTQ